MYLPWEIFCYSATLLHTSVAKFFSSEKPSAILLLCSHLNGSRLFDQIALVNVRNRQTKCVIYFFKGEEGGIGTKTLSMLDISHSHKADHLFWKAFSCQHINHIHLWFFILINIKLDSHSLVCFDIIHWFRGNQEFLATLLSKTLTVCEANITIFAHPVSNYVKYQTNLSGSWQKLDSNTSVVNPQNKQKGGSLLALHLHVHSCL